MSTKAMNPLDFPGTQFQLELLNPNPSSRMTKDGPVYKCSFEVTKEANEHFMTTNTAGLIIAAVCQVVESNPPKAQPEATITPENRLDEPEAPTPTASELHDEEPCYGKDGLGQDGFPKPVGKSEERRFAIQHKAKKETTDKQKEAAMKNYRAQPELTREAIGLCNNEQFQAYAAYRHDLLEREGTNKLAKAFIYAICEITSLKELTDDHPLACGEFKQLVKTFKKWRDK